MTTRGFLSAWVAIAALFMSFAARAAQSSHVKQVWAIEDNYWKYVQRGDVENYQRLWNNNFSGWPCTDPLHPGTAALTPVGKDLIWKWVEQIRNQKVQFSYDLHEKSARDFGTVVVVYYTTPMVYKYPDGHVAGNGQVYKFTHTWMRVGTTWQIIGGMCGSLNRVPQ